MASRPNCGMTPAISGPTRVVDTSQLESAFAFGFDAAMLAASAILIATLTLPKPDPRAAQPFWTAMKEGIRWLWANQKLRRLALTLGAYNFFSQMIWSVLVPYAQDVLGLSSVGYGVLLSAMAVGGLAGSMAAPLIIRRIGISRGLLISMTGFILSTGLLVFTSNPWIAGLALMGDAFTGMLFNITTVSYRQRHIPAPLLGRVNSAYRFIGSGTQPLGALAGGALVALAAPIGPWALHLPFATAAIGATALLIYATFRLRLD